MKKSLPELVWFILRINMRCFKNYLKILTFPGSMSLCCSFTSILPCWLWYWNVGYGSFVLISNFVIKPLIWVCGAWSKSKDETQWWRHVVTAITQVWQNVSLESKETWLPASFRTPRDLTRTRKRSAVVRVTCIQVRNRYQYYMIISFNALPSS